MCSNVKTFEVGLPRHPAVMFMNSNKSESNLHRIIQENRQKCSVAGIALMNETIVNKGPDRDIDRDAVNMLITRLISGQYDTVVVENMSDITADGSDLEEFMHDAANIGIGFFELSTMQYHIYDTTNCPANRERPVWDGGAGC
jgi:DNA invertase Pin-like site-specific DNA recombinase